MQNAAVIILLASCSGAVGGLLALYLSSFFSPKDGALPFLFFLGLTGAVVSFFLTGYFLAETKGQEVLALGLKWMGIPISGLLLLGTTSLLIEVIGEALSGDKVESK